MKYLKRHQDEDEYQNYSLTNFSAPNTSYVRETSEVYFHEKNYRAEYFTIKLLSSSTLKIYFGSALQNEIDKLYYKINDGEWNYFEHINNNTQQINYISAGAGAEIKFKANTGRITKSGSTWEAYATRFDSSQSFDVYGNILSLLYGDNFFGHENDELPPYAFCNLFYHSEINSAKNLILPNVTSKYCYNEMFTRSSLTESPKLPAQTMNQQCYENMFYYCTSLKLIPKCLPATTLATSCYRNMFMGCNKIKSSPQLPATVLSPSCYSSMFEACTSLISAPDLPAVNLPNSCYSDMFASCSSLRVPPQISATAVTGTSCCYRMFGYCRSLEMPPQLLSTGTLGNSCYDSMFYYCTSLTTAPSLPATTLKPSCYHSMFEGCTSLTTAPQLPATALTTFCYQRMFYECRNLNRIECLAKGKVNRDYTTDWVHNVASSGQFIGDPDSTWLSGEAGIPKNWTHNVNVIQSYEGDGDFYIIIDDFPDGTDEGYNAYEDDWIDYFTDGAFADLNSYINAYCGDPEEWPFWGNRYSSTGEAIEYDGDTYYVFVGDGEFTDSNYDMKYLLLDTNNFRTLVERSLEYDIDNIYNKGVGIFLKDDLTERYSIDERDDVIVCVAYY